MLTLTLRAETENRLVAMLDGAILATTPFDALPTLARLQADPFHLGTALTDALGGARLLARLDADADRVLLLACDARTDAIPWEFAALPNHQPLVAQYGVLRVLDGNAAPDARSESLQFLALAADPLVDKDGTPREGYRLRLDNELSEIRNVLRASRVNLHARRVPPTREKLRQALVGGPSILHLTCHGNLVETDTGTQAVLYLEDDDGAKDPLLGSDLVMMAPRGLLRVVLLSACYTDAHNDARLARALVQSGVPFAVGMQGTFPDALSDELAIAFYQTLLAGHSLAEALRQARLAIVRFTDQHGRFAFGLPVGYTTRDGWRALALAAGTPFVEALGMPGKVDFAGQITPPRPLLGRDRELHDLARTYSRGTRVVTVTGTGGIGKTALAASFAERFAWRWHDGVRAISFASGVNAHEFRRALVRALLGEERAKTLADADTNTQTETILRTLCDWNGLIILDNYESVLAETTKDEGRMTEDETGGSRQEAGGSLQGASCLPPPASYPASAFPQDAMQVHRLVSQMAEGGACLLLTSREQPAGLRGEAVFPDPHQSLRGLALAAGVQLFQEHSVKAKKAVGQ